MPYTLWALEPATEAKHRLYRSYLDAWWPILLQDSGRDGYRRPRVTYVDAFAGPGEYKGGEDGSPVFVLRRLLEHSRRNAMHLSRDRVHMLFVERDAARFAHLAKTLGERFGSLEDLPVTVHLKRGEADPTCLEMLSSTKAWGHPMLGVFDSWGNVNVSFDVISRIAKNKSSEVLVTFGPNWFSRREDLNVDIIDSVFGGREFWAPADRETRPDERWRTWLETYRSTLARSGFKFQLDFRVVPKTGLPLHLIYGTNNEAGVREIKRAMWVVDGTDGMGFDDPRTRGGWVAPGQMSLWGGNEGQVDPELCEVLAHRLERGAASVEELRQWLLLETARWREQDAASGVAELVREGVVVLEPSRGRLTAKSVVRLQ
jgi:three-Cys-motif partner protein